MGLTLNQIIQRIKTCALNHKQLRSFNFGRVDDFLNEKSTKYAACMLQDNGAVLDLPGKVTTYSFKLFLLDLVNIAAETDRNKVDVQSDMMLVGQDLLAQFDHSEYIDWKVSQSNQAILVEEEMNDMLAGAVIDFSISVPYLKDVCAVPSI